MNLAAFEAFLKVMETGSISIAAEQLFIEISPYPNMEEGIGTVALLQAMDKSLQTGMPVKIADILNEYGL